MSKLCTGDTLTIPATVIHAVDLGGDEANYCLELPGGHTTWVRETVLAGVLDLGDDEGKAADGPPETKAVPAPPARKGGRKAAVSA